MRKHPGGFGVVLVSVFTMTVAAACTTIAPVASQPSASNRPTPAASTALPGSIGPTAGATTALLPDPAASGDRVFTLAQPAEVEEATFLEIVEGWVEPPSADGQARYTFLARFDHRVLASPDPFAVNAGYYNAFNFTLRDDQGFEYPVIQGTSLNRQPELLYGNLNEGQQVQGWVTFEAPAQTGHVDVVYTPVSREAATYRAEVP